MVVLEAFVLLSVGLICGIAATTFDVIFMGAASFLSHISLLALLIVLISSHVESRLKAIWWAFPFTLGFIECYFITTIASYEGFSKSTVAPLAAVALVSPLLSYAAWTAKNEKNVYGNILSIIIMGGTLATSYVVNDKLSIYAVVMCLLIGYVLLFMPTRKLKITRAPLVRNTNAEAVDEESARESFENRPSERPKNRPTERVTERPKNRPTERVADRPTTRAARPTKRQRTAQDTPVEREPRRRRRRTEEAAPSSTNRRRTRQSQPAHEATTGSQPITLGHVRPARTSSRN